MNFSSASFSTHRCLPKSSLLGRVVSAVAALSAVAILATGCSDGVRDQQRSAAIADNAMGRMTNTAGSDVGLLFSIISPTMTIAAEGDGFRLTIPASASTAWFTDRPERNAGSFTAVDFVSLWSAEKFDDVPPNAAVVVTVNDEQHQHVVELTDPQTTDTTVSFHAEDVGDDEATDDVAGRGATHDVRVGTFTNAELFIDNGVGPPCPSSITAAGFSPCLIAANGKVTFKATISANSQQYAQITKPEPTDPNSTGAFTIAATATTSQNRTPWGPCANPCILQYFSGQSWTISAGSQAVNFTVDWLSQGSDEGDGYGNFDED